MTSIFRRLPTVATLVLGLSIVAATPAQAQSQVARKEGTWVVRDFRFHTGEVLPELRLHYATMGEPGGEPVLVLHGTTGSGTAMTGPAFGGELFGPGQPLDAARYFIILRTPLALASPASRRTACAPGSRSTTTMTWWMRSTAW
jgi:homoserine O-acetyltransferase